MKLIVVGATGLVGTEVLRLALRNPRVTSVIALARRSVEPPANAGPLSDTSKFRSVSFDLLFSITGQMHTRLMSSKLSLARTLVSGMYSLSFGTMASLALSN